MKLSFVLGIAGFTPEHIQTVCSITLEEGVIKQSHLSLTAKVPGISLEQLKGFAEEAKLNCPVSKALNMELTLDTTLAE